MQHPSVVTDTSQSQKARLKSIPISSTRFKNGFWGSRLEILRKVTLPTQYQKLEETGRVDNFRQAARKLNVPFHGLVFNDSDVYKWIEAAAWSLASRPDPELEAQLNTLISEIEDAQGQDGYLNTYFTFDKQSERWSNLQRQHELYCAGHLIQAAIAHYRSTGSNRLLGVATRFADLICAVFGPKENDKQNATPGHPEIEMALVELTRTTELMRYLKQAKSFLDMRGRGLIGGLVSLQDHHPFRRLTRMEGHAVRSAYLNAGATDIYLETGEPALIGTLDRLWENMTRRQMYVSGGIGSRYEREDFGEDHELPNQRSYAETCAAIGSFMWNWRMLMTEGIARFADLMELILYNAILVGLGLDGKSYFYVNPLADSGSHRRQPWFECACCPPNIARTLTSLPGYFYSISDKGIWIHLYGQCQATIQLANGNKIGLLQHTKYPWDGEIEIEVRGEGRFSIFLRIPTWSEGDNIIEINGRVLDREINIGDYIEISREWHPGDILNIHFPMSVNRIESHPHVIENIGCVALKRGPILYCLEGTDHPGVDLRDLHLPDSAPFTVSYQPNILNGVVVIRTNGYLSPPGERWMNHLYRAYEVNETESLVKSVDIMAVPYYAWANREAGQMQVWLRRSDTPK